jgi:hypothetical protein
MGGRLITGDPSVALRAMEGRLITDYDPSSLRYAVASGEWTRLLLQPQSHNRCTADEAWNGKAYAPRAANLAGEARGLPKTVDFGRHPVKSYAAGSKSATFQPFSITFQCPPFAGPTR